MTKTPDEDWNDLLLLMYRFFLNQPESFLEAGRERQLVAFRAAHPTVSISLKRFKKACTSAISISRHLKAGSVAFPEINAMVKCQMIPSMGKGLFASEDILSEERFFLFEENPLVFFPTWRWKMQVLYCV